MMSAHDRFDWDPFSPEAAADQIALYDRLRRRCPIAHSEALGTSLLRHADVMRVLDDPRAFSNAVSAHVSVPNGMDPPIHTDYRQIIDPYFSADRMQALEPRCRGIAVDLLERLPDGEEVEFVAQAAEEFALQAQCAFLNWPAELHRPLRDWVRKNHAATRSRNREAMAAVALEFDGHIRDVLRARRSAGANAEDVASELLREQIRGRHLADEEIVSILRNWTVGELATISASIGIIVQYLAAHPEWQRRLRTDRAHIAPAIDEMLRIEAPLMTSRRVTTEPVSLGGTELEAGRRIAIMWASANRDEQVFGDPDELKLDRDPSLNLLYGTGIHVCPGAPLARLELRVFVEELLARFEVERGGASPVRAIYPAGGFASVPVILRHVSQTS